VTVYVKKKKKNFNAAGTNCCNFQVKWSLVY